jgi:nucleolar protein 15
MVKKIAPEAKQSKAASRFNKLRLRQGDLSKKGVVYVGHLPKGFNENELKKFFGQFGAVTKLRVSRSPKTARPRGYAFLEFAEEQVAEIAAQTMNGYILFGRQLDCHVVQAPNRETFKNGNRGWKFVPTQLKFRTKHNAEKTDEQKAARVKGLLEKE